MSMLICKEALNNYLKGFYKDIHSVLDMGDQDLGLSYSLLSDLVVQANLKLDEDSFERARYFPERPRVSTSTFWKILGIEQAHRMDLLSIDRVNPEDQKLVIIKDLNEPLEDMSMWEKYDLVTDFGNNEHPFNIVESYRTMHRLTRKNGFMWIWQEVYGGNGYFNLDQPFFENLAAVNNYQIFDSAYVIAKSHHEHYMIPCEKGLLTTIDFGKVKSIGITYTFRKTNSDDFIIPYQDCGADKPTKVKTYYHSRVSVHDQTLLVRNYIPNSADSFSLKLK